MQSMDQIYSWTPWSKDFLMINLDWNIEEKCLFEFLLQDLKNYIPSTFVSSSKNILLKYKI